MPKASPTPFVPHGSGVQSHDQTWYHASESPTFRAREDLGGMTGGGMHFGSQQAAAERTSEKHLQVHVGGANTQGWPSPRHASPPRKYMQHWQVKPEVDYGHGTSDMLENWPDEAPENPQPYENDYEDPGSTSLWADPNQMQHVGTVPNPARTQVDGPGATTWLDSDSNETTQLKIPNINEEQFDNGRPNPYAHEQWKSPSIHADAKFNTSVLPGNRLWDRS